MTYLIWILVLIADVALVAVLYAAFVWWGGRDKGFQRWQVVVLAAVAPAWAAVVILWGL